VPVTAKLSKKFYETLGDDVANELVEWFNQVDTAYRSEFKDLFEVHFSRFDAKLEQRVGELNAKLEQRIAEVRGEIRAGLAGVETRLIRWMFVFWVANLGTTIALIKLLKV
jgi:hypothetical protein